MGVVGGVVVWWGGGVVWCSESVRVGVVPISE